MYEETLVILKPDALERRLVVEIIKRYESAGLEVLDIRFVPKVGEDLINRHYPESMARGLGEKARKASPEIEDLVAHGMNVLERLRRYVTRGPVIAIRMGGEDAIQTVRRVTG
ncbi:MAG: nucleoside-diphosphate kinase, partial [Candidatus Bathyarchaeota archaeon]|nr:nucleoside-diphosphate kinase [Candidatus Bathyarchaeota archaeon]